MGFAGRLTYRGVMARQLVAVVPAPGTTRSRAREGPSLALRTERALDRTEHHLQAERLRGWDPFDGLCSPLFSLPVLRSQRLLRFAAQQLIKRSRWNVRPLLRVPKQLNPVTIGLYLQGQAQRAAADPESRGRRREQAILAQGLLAAGAPSGYSGSCWGYPFDWETRHGTVPAGTPTVVATGMIANGLWSAHRLLGLDRAGELLVSCAAFVMRDLDRLCCGDDGTFCFSYAPGTRQAVLNATLKGSRLLAQAHALADSPDSPDSADRAEWLEAAARSARFVVAHQLPSGAWPYSLSDPRCDHFHTGYVLECLRAYRALSEDESVAEAIARGWAYYRTRLFTGELIPKYYDDRAEPLDATACAQAIITLCEFGDLEAAAAVVEHAFGRLARADGSYAYQERSGRTVTTPFLRWSTAWMYCALSRFAVAIA